jgi:peptidoglycan/LPS O-acetylase OafA/YrhL
MSLQTFHPSNPPKNRLDFIGSLRGLAALYVLTYHLSLIPNPPLEVPLWASKIILTGGTGVTLFFVVSAFTLTMSMRSRASETYPILGFYSRRFFRIVPLFYAWIVITWLRDRFWFGVTQSIGTVLLSMTFGFNLVPGRNEGFVWAGWTLGVEMLFYLMFPLIYRYVNDIWKASGFFFATLTLSSIFSYLVTSYLHLDTVVVSSFIKFSIFRQIPIFAFGILIYFVYERFIQNQSLPVSWGIGLVSISIFGYSAMQDGHLQIFFDNGYWQAIIYGILLLGLSIFPIGVMVNRLTYFYGEISYSLYLNHPTLVFALIPTYRFIYNLPIPLTIKYGVCFLITLGLLTAFSYITFHLIEKPGMRLGSNLAKNNIPTAAKSLT